MRWCTACRLTSATLQATRTPVAYSSRTLHCSSNTARASVARWLGLCLCATQPFLICKLHTLYLLKWQYQCSNSDKILLYSSTGCWMHLWAECNAPSRLAGTSVKHVYSEYMHVLKFAKWWKTCMLICERVERPHIWLCCSDLRANQVWWHHFSWLWSGWRRYRYH